mmetsp:Transcript_8154/g.15386  ORF Transcript_8154/g.15386 Transcript_8154/m.15386 type:complete len:460 (+) Transcript_8154:54-1433(+)
MQSNALLFCLACACHGQRVRVYEPSSSENSAILMHDQQQERSRFARQKPWTKLLSSLLAFKPYASYQSNAVSPSYSPLRAWSQVGHAAPAILMNQETAKLTLVEQLKAKAMRAALKAERASLEAEKLQLQAHQLKLKRSTGEAHGAWGSVAEVPGVSKAGPWRFGAPAEQTPVSASESPAQHAALWAEHKGKVHRFIKQDYKSADGGASYLCKTREFFLGTRKSGSLEGSFQVSFTLPGRESEPKTVELLQTSPGNPSFAAVQLKLLSFGTGIDEAEEKQLVEEDIPWHKNIGWSSRFNRVALPLSRFEDDELPLTRFEVRHVDLEFNHEFVEDDAFEMMFGGGYFSRIDIQPGDIIRGISLPEINHTQRDMQGLPWWEKPGKLMQRLLIGSQPDAGVDEGMLMLNGRDVGADAFNQVIGQHIFFKDGFKAGIQSDIVLLIERPEHPPVSNKDARGWRW